MPTSDHPAEQAAALLGDLGQESDRLDRIDRYLSGDHDGPYTPRGASKEYKLLATRAITNVLPLVVNTLAQSLYVEGFRTASDDAAAGWGHWQSNGLDARQSMVHRAALSYGRAYVSVLADEESGQPVIRGWSPRQAIAAYRRAGDEFPDSAVLVNVGRNDAGETARFVTLTDAEMVHEFTAPPRGTELTHLESRPHGLDVCPVVEFRHLPDLEDRAPGEIEPLIALQDRVNQSTFDLLVAQTFGSFKIRTVSGMTPPVDEEGKPKPLPVDAHRFLMARDPDVRFGQLDETDLRPLLDSIDAGVRMLAVVSQTPPSDLLGQLVNLSAEAIAAARDGATRKIRETQYVYGEAWERVLRLAARIAGDGEADEAQAQVTWRDVEGRSLSQTADALTKLAQGLEVPVEGLWSRIPGVTQTDIEAWQRMRATERAADPLSKLADHVRPGVSDGLDNSGEAVDESTSPRPA